MNIGLGAVQFGLDYGISGTRVKTPREEVYQLLEFAINKGINVLDTAPSYGISEHVIGKFVSSYDNQLSWNIVTKTPHFKNERIGNKQIDELLLSFELSKKKLGMDTLYGLLIHNCNNLFLPGGEKLLQTMEQLKKKGSVKKIGVSVYSGEQVDFILDNYSVDLVQLPVNILDQRLINGGQLDRLKSQGVEVHARSVFLQGLLLMPLNNVSSWFNPIRKVLEEFHVEAKTRNMSALGMALSFVQSIHGVDKVLVGVNTLEQLHEIINTKLAIVNVTEFSNLSINNPTFINPSNWKI
jgi:aryl-alcohol dehydrogenase-like predicted oxidoreductase